MKYKDGIILTELQKKVRRCFYELVAYGFKEKELIDLGGYRNLRLKGYGAVRRRIKRCNKLIEERKDL